MPSASAVAVGLCRSSALGTDEVWHLVLLGNALIGPAQIAHDLKWVSRWVQGYDTVIWPTSKGGNGMADVLADIVSVQLCGFTYEDPNEVCPRILREDGLAVLELRLVVILVNRGR